jgi:EpsI family protein
MITASRVSRASAVLREPPNLQLGLALLLTAGFFWHTVSSFAVTWERYDYSHGWLVPALLVWLVWSDRASFRDRRGGDPLLLVPLVGLSVFWLASVVTHIMLFHQTAFVLLMVFWGLYVFGRESGRTIVVSGFVVLLSLPLWEAAIPLLQRLTTLASGAMVKVVGVPARIEGDLIHIQPGSFEIAHGCAGLNYLLSALVIGLVYAHVLVKGSGARLAVVALAAAVSIVGNWVRVAMLVVIGHVTEMQSWLIPNHIEFGWVIFILGLVVFFWGARRIERRVERKASAAGVMEQGRTAGAAPAEANLPNGGRAEPSPVTRGEARPGAGGSWGRRLAVATGLAVAGPALYLAFGALPSAAAGSQGLDEIPRAAGWSMASLSVERPYDWHPAYEGAQQHDVMAFSDGGGTHVFADRFVYRKQAQRAKLIGHPNAIAKGRDVLDHRVVGPVDPAGRHWVRQAVVRTAEGPILTWYWYRVGGVDTFMPVYAKALEIPAFLQRRRVSELFALSAPCDPEDCASAFDALASFTGARRPETAPGATPMTRDREDPAPLSTSPEASADVRSDS